MKTTVILLCWIAVGANFAKGDHVNVCDAVYKAVDSEETNGNETPSPIDVNQCMNVIQDVETNCSFNVSQCSWDCGPRGRQSDDFGCPISCQCKTTGFMEEDIKFDKEDVPKIKQVYDTMPKGISEAASVGFKLWDEVRIDGRLKVPYVISSGMSTKARAAINQAFVAYTELTCIDFVVRTNQVNYIEFVSKGGCWSYIGRKGGKQEISIGFGCEWKGVVQHELMHALGFWHEQSRPDRDNFVKILTENIIAGKEHNFNKRNSINSLGSPYDLQSIMHYGGNAFSKNSSPTIVDRTTNQIIKAQREKFSDEDRVQLNLLYRCSALPITTQRPTTTTSVPVSWSNWGAWSACSVTCGSGAVTRTRQCIDATSGAVVTTGCVGPTVTSKSCKVQDCTTEPTTASWGQWRSWGSCSKSCGYGFQWRYRQCVNGVAGSTGCSGSSWSGRRCNTQACQPKPQLNLFTDKPSNGKFRFCRWGKLYTGDFNNDGRSDILCYYRNDWVRIGLGSSSTTYPSVHWEGPTRLCKFSPSSSKPGKVFVADFNADGKEDLMCMDAESGKMRILFNGNRSFHSEEVNWKGEFPNFCTAAENIFAEDVDGDGDADLLCRKSSGYISILKNQVK